MTRGGAAITDRDRILVDVAVCIARGERVALRACFDEALGATLRPMLGARELREVLMQSMLFAGWPRATTALGVLHAACDDAGVAWPVEAAESAAISFRARGDEVFREVYGDASDGIHDAIRALHPEMAEWLIADAYGKVLGRRDRLPLRDRELLAVAFLAALDQPREFQGHVRGAVRVGVAPATIRDAVDRASRALPSDRGQELRERAERELGEL